jgi:hypothetical protein
MKHRHLLTIPAFFVAAIYSWTSDAAQWLDSAYTKFALQTIRGNYVTAVNGGGVGGANTTDAVRHGAWETFTLVRLDTISGDSLKLASSPEPEWGAKLTRSEQAVIIQHFGKHPPYHVGVSRSRGFPEVLRVEQYIDDAGYRPLGTIVDGAWIESGVYSILWSPVEATRRVLMARGWTGLDDDRRKALALQWVEDSLPPGWSSQTSAEEGGHAPELAVEDGDVVIRVWLIRRGTSVAGPRVGRDSSASVFRFKPDGTMTEADSTHRTPPTVR